MPRGIMFLTFPARKHYFLTYRRDVAQRSIVIANYYVLHLNRDLFEIINLFRACLIGTGFARSRLNEFTVSRIRD